MKITDELAYQVAQEEAAKFAEALVHVDEENQNLSPRMRQGMQRQLEEEWQLLTAAIAEYESQANSAEAS